jgi:HlyD family secretion protein
MHPARLVTIRCSVSGNRSRSPLRDLIARVVMFVLLSAGSAISQEPEPIVAKSEVSVHRVERGTMALREIVTGSISSIGPARATVTLTPQQSTLVRTGQACSVQVVAPTVLHGKVERVSRDTLHGAITADIAIADPLGPATSIGQNVGALIDVGTTNDIVYFERPASARPNTTSTIFVLEADGEHARRVPVVYGRSSGSQLEIISGLAPGDRVIVTDLPALAGRNRVVLK